MARQPYSPGARGYHAIYREHERNHCPGCGRTHWIIGRITAECGFCGTALALNDGLNAATPRPTVLSFGKGGGRVR